MPLSVSAKNIIHSIDIDVYLNDDGSANNTEVWDVDGSDGTEWYKAMYNMANMKVSDFTVNMDGIMLTYKEWDINESLYEKKGYYGINDVGFFGSDVELCFGKYDYNRHVFTLNYKLSNFIINTNDSQLIYYNFIDKLSNVDFRKFSITISSYYEFPDTLDVWGYGYKGYAYVKNGKIYMSNEEGTDMNQKYSVLLAKFPLGTFNTTNSVYGYDDFKTVYKMSKKDSFSYMAESSIILQFINIVGFIVFLILFSYCFPFFMAACLGLIISLIRFVFGIRTYGYINNKKVRNRDIPMFRDIPCGGNICYAQVLLKLNN
jgi:hypothetical protein